MTTLKKLTLLENEASRFGFKWETASQILQQIQSECAEINVHLNEASADPAKLQEEIGDLLHAAFSLCVFCQFDPEETVEKSVMKFARRFQKVQELARAEGIETLNGYPFHELMKFWDQAKQLVG